MDPETESLLHPNYYTDVRNRRFRALSQAEVQQAREDVHWRRGRCLLIFFFWVCLAACLSLVACWLAAAGCVTGALPAVPPAHITLAPLVARARAASAVYEFAG